KQDRADCPRLRHGDELAKALGLDMAVWWAPSKERDLGRVSKKLILEAGAEGGSPEEAPNLAKLKKDKLVSLPGGAPGWQRLGTRPPRQARAGRGRRRQSGVGG